MEEIFVIGGNHHNTLGVIRALGYKGIQSNLILVTESKRPYTKYSKYIKRLFVVGDDNEAIKVLLEQKKYLKHAVVIACSDGASSAIDLNYDILHETYSIPGVKEKGRLTGIMNKETMSQIGKKMGFNVPDSWVVESVSDINKVEYPCITKPIVSKDGQKSDINICADKTMLEEIILHGSCYSYQVQKFIEKDFEYQVIGLSLDSGREVIIPGISLCIRPCPGTNTGFLHYVSLDDVSSPIDICKSFIQEIGYSGLFSIEFLRDKRGVDYFLEMNFRNDGNSICVTASGTNLPYIWYLANSNGDYQEEIAKSTFRSVFVMPEFADFSCFVVKRKISIWNWFNDICKTDKFMEFDGKDMKPFFIELSNKVRSFIKRFN